MKGIRDEPENVPLGNSLSCDEQEAFNPWKMPPTDCRCEKRSLHGSSHVRANNKWGHIAPHIVTEGWSNCC